MVFRAPVEPGKRSARRPVVDHDVESFFSLGLYQHAAQHGAGPARTGTVVALSSPPWLAPMDHISARFGGAVFHASAGIWDCGPGGCRVLPADAKTISAIDSGMHSVCARRFDSRRHPDRDSRRRIPTAE